MTLALDHQLLPVEKISVAKTVNMSFTDRVKGNPLKEAKVPREREQLGHVRGDWDSFDVISVRAKAHGSSAESNGLHATHIFSQRICPISRPGARA